VSQDLSEIILLIWKHLLLLLSMLKTIMPFFFFVFFSGFFEKIDYINVLTVTFGQFNACLVNKSFNSFINLRKKSLTVLRLLIGIIHIIQIIRLFRLLKYACNAPHACPTAQSASRFLPRAGWLCSHVCSTPLTLHQQFCPVCAMIGGGGFTLSNWDFLAICS